MKIFFSLSVHNCCIKVTVKASVSEFTCTFPTSLFLSFLPISDTRKKKSVKVVRINCRLVFFSPPRQLSALADRQHAAGRHRDHRRRPAAAVSRQPLRPLVLQFPRGPGLRRRPPDVLDPRGPRSKWMVSALLFDCGRVAWMMNWGAADGDVGCGVFVYLSFPLNLKWRNKNEAMKRELIEYICRSYRGSCVRPHLC